MESNLETRKPRSTPRDQTAALSAQTAKGRAPPPAWVGRRAPAASRRDAILRSVGAVLRDSKLASVTMQDIASQLGITKGNLYYYFKDKQDILFQCHMRCMEISLAALHEVCGAHDRHPDPLQHLLRCHIGAMVENGFGSVLLTDIDNLSPEQRELYVSKRDQFEAGVRQLIRSGVQEGIYECDDVKLASLALLGSVNWLPKWYRPDGELGPAEIAERLSRFLMKSLERKQPCKAVPRPKARPSTGSAKERF